MKISFWVYLLLPLAPERTPFSQKNQEKEAENVQHHTCAFAGDMKNTGIPEGLCFPMNGLTWLNPYKKWCFEGRGTDDQAKQISEKVYVGSRLMEKE